VAEEVHGIAKAGVEAVSDELAGLRGDGEVAAELEAGDGDEEQAEEKEDEAGDAQGSPGMRSIDVEDARDGDGRDDDEEEEWAIHEGMIARSERKWRVTTRKRRERSVTSFSIRHI